MGSQAVLGGLYLYSIILRYVAPLNFSLNQGWSTCFQCPPLLDTALFEDAAEFNPDKSETEERSAGAVGGAALACVMLEGCRSGDEQVLSGMLLGVQCQSKQ